MIPARSRSHPRTESRRIMPTPLVNASIDLSRVLGRIGKTSHAIFKAVRDPEAIRSLIDQLGSWASQIEASAQPTPAAFAEAVRRRRQAASAEAARRQAAQAETARRQTAIAAAARQVTALETRMSRLSRMAEDQQATERRRQLQASLQALQEQGKVTAEEAAILLDCLTALDPGRAGKLLELLQARPAAATAAPSDADETARIEAHYERFSEDFGRIGTTKANLVSAFHKRRQQAPETTAEAFLTSARRVR